MFAAIRAERQIGPPASPASADEDLSVATAALPDGRTLIITGDADGTVHRWDATTGQPIGNPLTAHTDTANASRSPTGRSTGSSPVSS